MQISTVHCLPDQRRYSRDHILCRSARRRLALQLYPPLSIPPGLLQAHSQGSGQLPWPAGVSGWCCWAGFCEVLQFASKFILHFFLTPFIKSLVDTPAFRWWERTLHSVPLWGTSSLIMFILIQIFLKLQKQIIWMQIDTDEVPLLAETKEPSTKTLAFNILDYRYQLSSWRWKSCGKYACWLQRFHARARATSMKAWAQKLLVSNSCRVQSWRNNTKKTKVPWSLFDPAIFSKTSKERVTSNSPFATPSSLTCVNQLLE